MLINDTENQYTERRDESFAFLSESFRSMEMVWSTLEQERSAVLTFLEHTHWLVATPEIFYLFKITTFSFLLFILFSRFIAFAVRLSQYATVLRNMKVEKRVLADFLGLWCTPGTMGQLVEVPVLSSAEWRCFVWRSIEGMWHEQNDFSKTSPSRRCFPELVEWF